MKTVLLNIGYVYNIIGSEKKLVEFMEESGFRAAGERRKKWYRKQKVFN